MTGIASESKFLVELVNHTGTHTDAGLEVIDIQIGYCSVEFKIFRYLGTYPEIRLVSPVAIVEVFGAARSTAVRPFPVDEANRTDQINFLRQGEIATGTDNETIKIGNDNPDNCYFNTTIDGRHDYVITGNRGTVNLKDAIACLDHDCFTVQEPNGPGDDVTVC